jgi:hypothetical protein
MYLTIDNVYLKKSKITISKMIVEDKQLSFYHKNPLSSLYEADSNGEKIKILNKINLDLDSIIEKLKELGFEEIQLSEVKIDKNNKFSTRFIYNINSKKKDKLYYIENNKLKINLDIYLNLLYEDIIDDDNNILVAMDEKYENEYIRKRINLEKNRMVDIQFVNKENYSEFTANFIDENNHLNQAYIANIKPNQIIHEIISNEDVFIILRELKKKYMTNIKPPKIK